MTTGPVTAQSIETLGRALGGRAERPRGRPRGRHQDYALTARLPAPMYDALCHLAALKRLSVSATVRRLIAYQLEHPRAF